MVTTRFGHTVYNSKGSSPAQTGIARVVINPIVGMVDSINQLAEYVHLFVQDPGYSPKNRPYSGFPTLEEHPIFFACAEAISFQYIRSKG